MPDPMKQFRNAFLLELATGDSKAAYGNVLEPCEACHV